MGVQVIDFDKLEAKLTKNMDLSAVRTVVRKNGSEMQKKAQKKMHPVDTGHLMRAVLIWKLQMEVRLREIEPTADSWSICVELGTRFMNAQPYLKPAFDEQKGKFKSDMKNFWRVIIMDPQQELFSTVLVALKGKI